MVILGYTVVKKSHSKSPDMALFCRNNFRLEETSDVISGMAVEEVGLAVQVIYGDSMSSRS